MKKGKQEKKEKDLFIYTLSRIFHQNTLLKITTI